MNAAAGAGDDVGDDLGEEHRALRDAVRRFVDRDVSPHVAERERADDYPADLLPILADLGVLGMSIPEEFGGTDLDLVGYALVFEELARGWMGLASVVGSSGSGSWLIGRYGTDEQRRRYLPDLAAGRRVSGIALTEPSTGSDLKAIKLSAVRRDDHYVVTGTKTMITQARHADPLVVLAVTDRSAIPPHHGMTLLLVEQDTVGCSVGRDIGKLGHRGVELCEVRFDDAVVPAANALGGVEGKGLHQMLAALDRGRIYMAASSVGIARASLEAAVRYATEREAFGTVIGQHQAIKLKLATMAIRVRAARLLTHAAAQRIERDGRASSDAAMAKVFASETAIDCSLDAMRILGGYGFTTEFPVERLYRDAPLMAIGEGTNEILQLLIADELWPPITTARARKVVPVEEDGVPAYWSSTVSRVESDTVFIRGYDLEDLIGGQSFTASCFLLLRGRLPTPGEVRVLDAVLNAVLDYALLKPGTVAARYAVSGNPNMVAGIAAAVMSVGKHTLAPEDTARFIVGRARRAGGVRGVVARGRPRGRRHGPLPQGADPGLRASPVPPRRPSCAAPEGDRGRRGRVGGEGAAV